MGRSGKSRSRKTDKETQSPMLKIFKDIMQRENNDPEKRNLLKDHHEEKKKMQYPETKSKSEHVTVDSSGTERCKRSIPYRTHEQRNLEYEQDKRQSTPFPSDKKESWWLWGDNEKGEREESCSCVSCALKKLAGSEFMCVGCLLTIFTLSVMVAFLLVFRSVPTTAVEETELQKSGTNSDSERMKRKIDLMKERQELNWDLPTRDNKKPWEDSISRPLDGLSAISGDFALSNFRDLNNLEIGSRSAELSSVLGSNNVFDFQNSDRLREFYRKLIQTDAQINMLKKGATEFTLLKTDDEKLNNILDRTKRSLNIHKKSNIRIGKEGITKRKRDCAKHSSKIENDKMKQNNDDAAKNMEVLKKYQMNINNREFANSYPNNRNNDSLYGRNKINDATKGIIIEKSKLLVQHKSGERMKVPKCSHAPKEGKSHENQLKHPFYKNTQRLDEMLDHFMEKGLPGILADSFSTDVISKNKCKHPNVDGVKVVDKDFDRAKTKPQTSKEINKNNIYEFTTEPRVKETNKDGYDAILSISTLLNPEFKSLEDMSSDEYLGRGFNYRKLMQADEVDEENLGYEDLKEVLTDDLEGHDDTDNRGERTKRNEDSKYQLPSVYNQNWKGPMPLYPDEINSMIRHAALSANNPRAFKGYEAEARLNNKDESPEIEKKKFNVGDIQYIEDYLFNKYDKLAQAYSDYGLLDAKKESVRNEKDEGMKTPDHRVKLSVDKNLLNGGFFDRLKKGTQPSEGIRFEVRPSESSQTHRDDKPIQVYKYLQKHVKISHDISTSSSNSPLIQSSIIWPLTEKLDLMNTSKTYDETQSTENFENEYKNDDSENDLLFKMNKGIRSLKSVDVDSDLNEDVEFETDIFDYKNNISEVETKNYNYNSFNVNKGILGFDHHILKREINDNIIYSKKKNVNFNETKLVTQLNFNQNTTAGNEEKENLTKNKTDEVDYGLSLSDFFVMLSNFFSFLDGVEVNDSKTNSSSSATTTNGNVTSNATSDLTTQIYYPVYDSEVIDNIGHRSRVLMSIEEKNVTKAKFSNTKEADSKREADDIIPTESSMATDVTMNIATPLSTTKPSLETVLINTNKNKNVSDATNKNIVKRNVDDTNLIFWNDMYDEEYGVDTDHLENNVRDKHSAKVNNIVQSSSAWFKDKVRKLTNNIRKKTVKESSDGKQRTIAVNLKSGSTSASNKIIKKINKRDLKMIGENADSGKIDFAALTANMKEVCKKAAKAVQHTRNVEVREVSKESSVASSLMQQLVRLMNDLVDFQVQQKTCLKLPPDLQNFLEWLTTNDKTEDIKRGYDDIDNILTMDNMATYDKPTDSYLDFMTPVTEKEIQTLGRSDSQGTLHAVQDLMQQYEEMSEEDKSKMIGIKQYLENQLDYLQKQLNSMDYYNTYPKTNFPLRYQRSLFKNARNAKNNQRLRRNLSKFVKISGKKHTKTTASINEYSNLNDINRNLIVRSNTVKKQSVPKTKEKVDVNKRNFYNLNNIDGKALSDTKKREAKEVYRELLVT